MMFLVLSILSASNSSKLSFSEIENVPNKVQDKINLKLRLQSINEKNGVIDVQVDGKPIPFDVVGIRGFFIR